MFTLLLVHLILHITPHHSHHLRSHHLSLPRPFTTDLKLISFTNPGDRELLLGQRPVGVLWWSDHICSVLRKCNIQEAVLEELAADRELCGVLHAPLVWRASKHHRSKLVASDRRAHTHADAVAIPAGPVCPHCGRICASDFGLRSHIRIHLRPHNWHYISATSSSKSTDYHKQP